MLQIKKATGKKEQWIVYNPHNFKYHTHCYSLRVARLLRDNVNHKREPRTVNIRLLESHMRLTADRKYREMIQRRIDSIGNP